MEPKSFTDLNADVLLHIAALLSPPPPTLGVHWLNGAQPLRSNADVRALRATCRHARYAIPPGDLDARIADGLNVYGEILRWAEAPGEVLERVKRITLPPSSRGPDLVLPPIAQRRVDAFTTLLSRCPNLTALEIAHSPFCAHDAYGLGNERRFAFAPARPPNLRITTLSVALKCRICAVELTRTLASWCTLTSLRASVVTFVPPRRVLPRLVAHLGALRTLHLKVGDDWSLPALLRALAPCKALKELHVAPYDASRKVAVVDSLAGPGGVLGVHAPTPISTHFGIFALPSVAPQGQGNGLEAFLAALSAFELEELDLCISPAAVDRSLADMDDGPVWREKAAEAAEKLVAACPTLRRGWWWIQVVDLDYRQLQGYERWAWTVEEGKVRLAGQPRYLAPLVVRNQDGQGTTVEIPSEEWN